MKRNLTISIGAATILLLLLPALGLCASYQSMTTEELSNLRGTMYNASQEDRDTFREEWRKRIAAMTPEEKQRYLGAGGGRGQGNRAGDGLGDGTGRGRGGGGINASGNDSTTGQSTGRGSGTQ